MVTHDLAWSAFRLPFEIDTLTVICDWPLKSLGGAHRNPPAFQSPPDQGPLQGADASLNTPCINPYICILMDREPGRHLNGLKQLVVVH